MSLKTRVDGRSGKNDTILIKDINGRTVATIKVANNVKVELEIETDPDLHVAKPNGWSSQKLE